jgi:predicted transcriptional regulator
VTPKPRRKPGRPKRSERPIGPAELEEIANRVLQNQPVSQIARAMGVAESTIRYHVENAIKPRWEHDISCSLTHQRAKVDRLEALAWERFLESQKPQTRREVRQELQAGGADAKTVARVLTRTRRTGEPVWLEIIEWCIDWRCKIAGHYAAKKFHVENSGELRVAGCSPSEVDESMLRRLAEKIAERKAYEDRLRRAGV